MIAAARHLLTSASSSQTHETQTESQRDHERQRERATARARVPVTHSKRARARARARATCQVQFASGQAHASGGVRCCLCWCGQTISELKRPSCCNPARVQVGLICRKVNMIRPCFRRRCTPPSTTAMCDGCSSCGGAHTTMMPRLLRGGGSPSRKYLHSDATALDESRHPVSLGLLASMIVCNHYENAGMVS